MQIQDTLYQKVNFELTEIITAEKKIDLKKHQNVNSKMGFPCQLPHQWKDKDKINTQTKGIENLGNTCYLNSVLQVLLNTPYLYYYSREDGISFKKHSCQQKKNFCIECVLLSYFKPIRKQILYPHQLVNKLRILNNKFVRGRQQDSHEFFLLVLNNSSRKFYEPFQGFLTSRITCPKNHISDTEEKFYNLSLPLIKAGSVKKALSNYFAPTCNIQGYYCKDCRKKRTIQKQYLVKDAPEVLVIQLLKFDNRGQKFNKFVPFEEEMNFYGSQYTLYGMVEHLGYSIRSGHYVSYIKSGNNLWYRVIQKDE